MRGKVIRKRIMLILIVVVLILTSFVSTLVSAFVVDDTSVLLTSVSADSNDRRRALISFARNRNLTELTEDGLAALENEDLVMLGTFLSNFYVPWSTSVNSKSKGHEESVEKMVQALVDCNFEENTAKIIVQKIFKMSEDTHQQLYVNYTYYDDSGKTSGSEKDYEATWLDFLYICSVCGQYRLNGDKCVKGVRYLYWKSSDGAKHPVFDATSGPVETGNTLSDGSPETIDLLKYTPSTSQYSMLSTSLNYANGLAGNSLIMWDKETFASQSSTVQEKLFFGNAPLSVDCFGNIIADCGTEALIVLPAAANPYLWKPKGTAEDSAGIRINAVNLFNIGYLADGNGGLHGDNKPKTTIKNKVFVGPHYDEYGSGGVFHSATEDRKDSIYDSGSFRISRGSSDYKVDTVTNNWFGKTNTEDDVALSKFLKEFPNSTPAQKALHNLYTDADGGNVIDDVGFFAWGTHYYGLYPFGDDVVKSPDSGFAKDFWDVEEAYTDMIMINTLGDLEDITDLYSGSITSRDTTDDTDDSSPPEDEDDIMRQLNDWGFDSLEALRDSLSNQLRYNFNNIMTSSTYRDNWNTWENNNNTRDFGGVVSVSDTNGWARSYFGSYWSRYTWRLQGIARPTDEVAPDAFLDYVLQSKSGGIPYTYTGTRQKSNVWALLNYGIQGLNDSIDLERFARQYKFWCEHSDSLGYTEDAAARPDTNTFTESTDGSILVVKGIFNNDGSMVDGHGSSVMNSFESITADGQNEVSTMPSGMTKAYSVSIYLSYIYAYFGGDDNPLSWEYNSGGFPPVESGKPDWGDIEIDVEDERTNMIMSMLYYILHPMEGIEFVKTWFKNKVGGILAGWHEDMAGASHTTATTGTTRYVGFAGYVTTPQLTDLPWTDWLLTQYDSLVVYFIIIMIVILLLYVIVGTLTIQKAIVGVVIFAFCAYLPPRAINMAVDVSNNVCDTIYGSKFTYWALVQHQQYSSAIRSAVGTQDNDQYLSTIFQSQVANASDDYAVVTVKWMCPKKDNYMAEIEQQLIRDTGDSHTFRLIRGLVADTVSGEDYLDSADSLYLYRSYTDISTYSYHGWQRASDNIIDLGSLPNDATVDTGRSPTGVVWDSYMTNYTDAVADPTFGAETLYGKQYSLVKGMKLGFETSQINDGTASGGVSMGSFDSNKAIRIQAFMRASSIDNAVKDGLSKLALTEDILDASTVDTGLAGVPQKDMQFGLHSIANISASGGAGSMRPDQIGDFVYANYTESPFYYFSYNLYDQLMAASERSDSPVSDYKGLFLSSGKNSYFYNMSELSSQIYDSTAGTGHTGYGQLRDYMDMRSLFCVVIPRLKQANDVVVEWDNTYGLTLYEDVPINYTATGELEIPAELASEGIDSELAYKFWHNANVVQLFNMYTPWVDTMYDCNYAKEETINVNGDRFVVKDPIDPHSYYTADSAGNITAGRPMIFSRSEMEFYGLRESDLTTVESKILEVQDNSYEVLLQLMDYYSFEEEVLNTAAAMLETFEFNKVFSQTSPFEEDYVLYPQGYELKNFSYDAYLRLMLSNTTGEAITDNIAKTELNKTGSYYQNIIQNSSIMTGIMMIIVDLFAVYAVPALKLFFIVAIFILSVLVILAASVSLEIRLQEVIFKSLFAPLAKYLGISIGMAFAVSLFMSDGNTAVTNRKSITISLGDPVMLLIVMLVINAGVLVLYFKLCKSTFSDVKKYFKAIGASIMGTFGGAFAKLTGALSAGKTSVMTSEQAVATGSGVAGSSRGSLQESVRTPKSVGAGAMAAAGAVGGAIGAGASKIRNSARNRVGVNERISRLQDARATHIEDKIEAGKAKSEYNREIQSKKKEMEKTQTSDATNRLRARRAEIKERAAKEGWSDEKLRKALGSEQAKFNRSVKKAKNVSDRKAKKAVGNSDAKMEFKAAKRRKSASSAGLRTSYLSMGKKNPTSSNRK